MLIFVYNKKMATFGEMYGFYSFVGQDETLSYAIEGPHSALPDGCRDFTNTMREGQEVSTFYIHKVALQAAKEGNINLLKTINHGLERYGQLSVMDEAARNGQLLIMKYAHQNHYPWDITITGRCAENGHIKCLKYAHENGCLWDSLTCSNAAMNGHFKCLKYAHENGCLWDSSTCSSAAMNGHLRCLKYAHENGCPWNEETSEAAARSEEIACLKYACENGCKWSIVMLKLGVSCISVARYAKQRDNMKYLIRLEVDDDIIFPPVYLKKEESEVCLLVSDSCKILRNDCRVCVPLLTETLDGLLWEQFLSWPRALTELIVMFV